jgi:hypothetical protein
LATSGFGYHSASSASQPGFLLPLFTPVYTARKMVLRSLTMVARPILRASASTSATTAAAGDLARLAPHQQIPFSVAPSPKVEGLAQVHLPDMASIEPVYTQATLIVRSLCSCGWARTQGWGPRCGAAHSTEAVALYTRPWGLLGVLNKLSSDDNAAA